VFEMPNPDIIVTTHGFPAGPLGVIEPGVRAPVGTAPVLPGVVAPSARGELTVRGHLVGTGLVTSTAVTVSEAFTARQNLAPEAVPSASFSGAPTTVPASLNDGVTVDPAGWSNQYVKAATALLPAFSLAQPSDWVSLTWMTPQPLDTLVAYFHLASGRPLPAAVSVEYWDGHRFAPAANQAVTWATASDQPTTIRFDKVSTTQVRLVLTSAAPGTSTGFVQISELQAMGDRSTAATSPVQETEREHGGDVASGEAASGGCAVGGKSSVALLIGVLAIVYGALRRWRRSAA
jgi:hypothetical protein